MDPTLVESLGIGFATGVGVYGLVFGCVTVIRLFLPRHM